MTEEQLAQATAGTTEHRDVNVRQVANGFVLSGNRRWLEEGTGAVRAQLQIDAIAESSTDAASKVSGFLNNGKF